MTSRRCNRGRPRRQRPTTDAWPQATARADTLVDQSRLLLAARTWDGRAVRGLIVIAFTVGAVLSGHQPDDVPLDEARALLAGPDLMRAAVDEWAAARTPDDRPALAEWQWLTRGWDPDAPAPRWGGLPARDRLRLEGQRPGDLR